MFGYVDGALCSRDGFFLLICGLHARLSTTHFCIIRQLEELIFFCKVMSAVRAVLSSC